MKFIETPLAGAYVIEPEPFRDDRGTFMRTFCQKEFIKIGFNNHIVQINHSITQKKGTIRGMHYQCPPACEIKIIRCISGEVFDVMVDIRTGSSTFMQWYGVKLSRENLRMVYVPKGFAHGFQTLSNNVELIYHHSTFYSPEYEHGFRYDDSLISIKWPLILSDISQRDISHPVLSVSFGGIEV